MGSNAPEIKAELRSIVIGIEVTPWPTAACEDTIPQLVQVGTYTKTQLMQMGRWFCINAAAFAMLSQPPQKHLRHKRTIRMQDVDVSVRTAWRLQAEVANGAFAAAAAHTELVVVLRGVLQSCDVNLHVSGHVARPVKLHFCRAGIPHMTCSSLWKLKNPRAGLTHTRMVPIPSVCSLPIVLKISECCV